MVTLFDGSDDTRPRRLARALARLRTRYVVALCVLFTLALRLPFLGHPLMPDEAGLLLVARHWSEGPYLYGDYFVGRGILAVGAYRLGDLLGGPLGVRLLAAAVAVALVVAAGWAGAQLRGRAGAGWAALVAAAYGSTYLFQGEVMNERLLAAALVMASVAMVLFAARRPSAWWRSVVAGVLASLPLLVVQSYADGLAFGGAYVVVAVLVGELRWAQAVRLALGGAAGVALNAVGVAVTLALTPMTASQFWFQMLGFRLQAADVIGLNTTRPGARLEQLVILAGYTGMLLIVVCLLTAAAAVLRRRELRAAWVGVVAMLLVSLYGMYAGADYWADYLLQPIPALALAVALVAPVPRLSGWGMRLAAVVAAVVTVVGMSVKVSAPGFGSSSSQAAVGTWVRAAARPGDTATVIWGQANLLYSAGLDSPYPFLWSLLTRTLDNDLRLIVRTLDGPDAPTWVVVWLPTNTWNLDSAGRLSRTLERNYRVVGTPCGKQVLLRRGVRRPVPPDSSCGG